MRWAPFAVVLVGCAGQQVAPPPTSSAEPIPASATSTPRGEHSSEPTTSEAASHLCAGTAQPEPCKNDVMRQGGFQEVPACLRVLPPTATGSADGKAFESALSNRSNAIFECITGGGADTSQLGKVMTVRVVSTPGKPSQTSFVSTDLSPAAKSCVEKAVTDTKWPEAVDGTSEVTLRLVLITRVWVDDPKGACPPR
jgi:hypothetical protein